MMVRRDDVDMRFRDLEANSLAQLEQLKQRIAEMTSLSASNYLTICPFFFCTRVTLVFAESTRASGLSAHATRRSTRPRSGRSRSGWRRSRRLDTRSRWSARSSSKKSRYAACLFLPRLLRLVEDVLSR